MEVNKECELGKLYVSSDDFGINCNAKKVTWEEIKDILSKDLSKDSRTIKTSQNDKVRLIMMIFQCIFESDHKAIVIVPSDEYKNEVINTLSRVCMENKVTISKEEDCIVFSNGSRIQSITMNNSKNRRGTRLKPPILYDDFMLTEEEDELIECLNKGGTLTVEDLINVGTFMGMSDYERVRYCEANGLEYGR